MSSFRRFFSGMRRRTFAAADDSRAFGGDMSSVRILAIEPDHVLMRAIRSDFGAAWASARFRDLDHTLLNGLRPGLILAPLSTAEFDILDLAERLATLGYDRRLRAVTAPLPNPVAVATEIRGHCGVIDFDLIVLGQPMTPSE